MAERQKWTCPQCSQTIPPDDDSIIFVHGRLSYLNCQRPRTLGAEERTLLFVYCQDHRLAKCAACVGNSRLQDLASDLTATLLGGRAYLCRWCRRDLSDSVRVLLYGYVRVAHPDMARPRPEKKPESTPPTTRRVLPMELQVGDRFSDETGEWEVVAHPYMGAGGKIAYARVNRVRPANVEVRSWSAHERISAKRT